MGGLDEGGYFLGFEVVLFFVDGAKEAGKEFIFFVGWVGVV